MDYGEKLAKIISEKNVACEQLHFPVSCHTVAEAAAAVGGDEKDFVKNICLLDANNSIVVLILKGEDKLDLKKVCVATGLTKLRFASAQEILEKTGFPVGGTPSFGYDATFLVDERVLEKEIVYSGGGSQNALVKISPKEMLKANGANVFALRK